MFVLDCSVLLSAIFPDEVSHSSEQLIDDINLRGAWVPALWWYEVASGLCLGVRRKRISESQRVRFMLQIQQFSLETDIESIASRWPIICDLALEHDLTSYDAAYLELAKRLKLPLATHDKALKKAAKKCGVRIYEF